MEIIEIFGLQFALSLTVIGLIAAWRVGPWLDRLELRDALFWITVPHAFRHLGMVFWYQAWSPLTYPIPFPALRLTAIC
jgi:hypothetical protein